MPIRQIYRREPSSFISNSYLRDVLYVVLECQTFNGEWRRIALLELGSSSRVVRSLACSQIDQTRFWLARMLASSVSPAGPVHPAHSAYRPGSPTKALLRLDQPFLSFFRSTHCFCPAGRFQTPALRPNSAPSRSRWFRSGRARPPNIPPPPPPLSFFSPLPARCRLVVIRSVRPNSDTDAAAASPWPNMERARQVK